MLDEPCRQSDFGALVGISQPTVSDLVSRGVLENGATLRQWCQAYCGRLREQAAGRLGSEVGGLDLAQERAALARAQRDGIELKNAVLRGQFASIELLSEVLATVSQAVAEGFDHLPGQLRKMCPDLPQEAVDQVMATIASARNQWVRGTSELVATRLVGVEDDDEESPTGLGEDEPTAD